MREYEVTIIIQPKLEEEPRNEIIDRVTGWLVGGEVTDENRPTSPIIGDHVKWRMKSVTTKMVTMSILKLVA